MKEDILYPSVISHRVIELFSDAASNETKVHIARFYAEMIVSDFLIDKLGGGDFSKKIIRVNNYAKRKS
ncbi:MULTISPECIES: hypothetical protein [unclassified Tatumella]|uniref:hypothetical protein n=1 Tax=unclassified Tatumella TaxID=2649542 RepID=UPI001BAF3AAE|nr:MULTISPECIES: hypothetical protein [unclassified Tatumella]MBS0857674.1 hypothetical protein [Tatumella sp. JGM16]MBS0914373.1 hypothetical protein [Tatumella sp. JGM91]